MRGRATALAVTFATLLAAAPAGASSTGSTPSDPSTVEQQLADARVSRDADLARLDELRTELDALLTRYLRLERVAGRASLELVTASMAEQTAEHRLEDAQATLDARVRAAYETGPGGILDALLGAESFTDLFTASEYAARTISADTGQVDSLGALAAHLASDRAVAEAARDALAPEQLRLARLLAELQSKVEGAQRLADRAGSKVASLERQRRRIEDAAARQIGRNLLPTGETARDQSALLALLGPTEGKTCDTPEGLVDTGKRFSGFASWYGWELGGSSTANGAIFDPRLFTAANRWLPLGTFLKVHYGGRCALVLVNDRGPYGHLERVIDLSMAAARYLGVGVSWVTADILVPADGIPT
jgi:rare lipoprotein A (peptidoglycan hydrolase)